MKIQLGLHKFLSTFFFYLVIIASNHKSHRLFIWPWHLDQPIINWFDFCFFISIYPHKSVYTGQLMMKDWCTHSMAIRNAGPRWRDKQRCCKSQSAFRCNEGLGVDHSHHRQHLHCSRSKLKTQEIFIEVDFKAVFEICLVQLLVREDVVSKTAKIGKWSKISIATVTAGNFTMIKIHKDVVDAGLWNDEIRVGQRWCFGIVNIILYANVQNQSWLLKLGI